MCGYNNLMDFYLIMSKNCQDLRQTRRGHNLSSLQLASLSVSMGDIGATVCHKEGQGVMVSHCSVQPEKK